MTDFNDRVFRKRSRNPVFRSVKAAHKAGMLSLEELALFVLAAERGTFTAQDLLGPLPYDSSAYTRVISLLRYWRGGKDRRRGRLPRALITQVDTYHTGDQGKPYPVYGLTAEGKKLYEQFSSRP